MKSKRTLDMEEELCACSIDVFDSVIWKKLMKILHGNGIDWREKKIDRQIVHGSWCLK